MTRAHCLPPVPAFCSLASLKDTTVNLKNGQGFAVNIISEAFVENANATAVDAPPDFDEWALSGLTKEKCVQIRASRVKESAFSMYHAAGESSAIAGGLRAGSMTLWQSILSFWFDCTPLPTKSGMARPPPPETE
ncbi:hypothetical protein C8R48DRAFT_738083 [Suillus tomentosus]|nr:hypothetical protein C8R48DRAFT_738083 [Suillus tomentosus]